MKKQLALCLAAALLLGCLAGCRQAPPAEESDPTQEALFTRDTLPRLDGSTANIPLALLMLQRVTDLSAEEADALVDFSTTPYAYSALVAGNADLLLVYEADETMKAALASSDVKLESHTIGYDALVFLTNTGNPVVGLTTTQIQDIYQGKITNWSEVGGEDKSIEAYQRPQLSGSQALMIKLVMEDLPLMEAPVDRYPHEMSGLIYVLATYNNTANALGYSVYYYAQNMYSTPDLKMLAVDGVQPDNTTIADGSYPFVNPFFAIIRADEPEDSPARQMLAWIQSPEGRQTILDAGYVAA